MESTSKLLTNNKLAAAATSQTPHGDDTTLSSVDRYDLSVFQRQQYFPQPEKVKTEDERLEEERERLGLKKPPLNRKQSVQEHDQGPRHQISKLSEVHQTCLNQANDLMTKEEDEKWGDGTIICEEIDEQIRLHREEKANEEPLSHQPQTYVDFKRSRELKLEQALAEEEAKK